MSKRFVDQAFHLSRSISEDVLFLTAQLTLLFAKFALLLAQRSLLLSELSLSLARLGLQVAKFALQVADFFLNASKILFRTGLSKSFQLRFQFVQVFGHIRDFNANSLLLFSQGFLLLAKRFLLFAEFVLFLFDRVELTEKIRRAFNSCLIANHVGLAVMPEPYEIAGNLFLQEFNEFGRLVHAGAFAIAGNADVHFTGRNHKLLTITVRAPNEYRGI